MKTALQKLGYKIITDHTYLASAAYCVRGAVYVKASSHTVCGLDNGADYKKTLEKAGITAKCSGTSYKKRWKKQVLRHLEKMKVCLA